MSELKTKSETERTCKAVFIKNMSHPQVRIEIPDCNMTMREFMLFLIKRPEAKKCGWYTARKSDTFSCHLIYNRKLINEFSTRNSRIRDMIDFDSSEDPTIHSVWWTLGGPDAGSRVWGNLQANKIEDANECAVCCESFEPSQESKIIKTNFRLECCHIFHTTCLRDMLDKTPSIPSCPICRSLISGQDILKVRAFTHIH